jgi:hypothetical protein
MTSGRRLGTFQQNYALSLPSENKVSLNSPLDFLFCYKVGNDSWNQILPSLSQAFTTNHSIVFILILSISEGRVDIAWVPSNKMPFLLHPDIKRL